MIQENKEYQELFTKWNKLANEITYLEPTPENFRELAKMSEKLAEMIEAKPCDICVYYDKTKGCIQNRNYRNCMNEKTE